MRRVGLNKAESDQQCEYCSRLFSNVVDLETHEKQIHTRMKCRNCDYVSFGERDLKEHNCKITRK